MALATRINIMQTALDEKDVNGKALDGQNLIDVLFDLAKKIGNKHKESIEKKPFPDANEVSPGLVDEANVVTQRQLIG
jgi:hypothetical protein